MDLPVAIVLRFRPAAVTGWLALGVAALVVAHVAGSVARALLPDSRYVAVLVRLVDLNAEANLPTWYSSAALLLCGGLLALIARTTRRERGPHVARWAMLAVVFCGLSIDELTQLHELTTKPLRAALRAAEGPIYYTWVVLGAAMVAVVGALSLPLLLHLPARIRRLFVVAAGLFVSGALGMEMIEGIIRANKEGLAWALAVSVEETLEMAGVVVFVHALLSYLAGGRGAVGVQVSVPARASPRIPPP